MALGYCGSCDTLRSITPGPQKWGSRECRWFPVRHWILVHDNCGEFVEESSTPDADLLFTCRKHGVVPRGCTEFAECDGYKREIK